MHLEQSGIQTQASEPAGTDAVAKLVWLSRGGLTIHRKTIGTRLAVGSQTEHRSFEET